MLAFSTFLKAGQPLILTERVKLAGPASQNFMRITLVSNVKKDFILRRIKYLMQSDRQLDDAQIAGQMSAGLADMIDQEFPNLLRQRFKLPLIQLL